MTRCNSALLQHTTQQNKIVTQQKRRKQNSEIRMKTQQNKSSKLNPETRTQQRTRQLGSTTRLEQQQMNRTQNSLNINSAEIDLTKPDTTRSKTSTINAQDSTK